MVNLRNDCDEYFPKYSYGWLKERWKDMGFITKVENLIRTIAYTTWRQTGKHLGIVIVLSVALCVIGISQCEGCVIIDLSYNGVSQTDIEKISDAFVCDWSERHKACFCVYANGGAAGGFAPKEMCDK